MDCCHQYNICSLHIHTFTCLRVHKEHMILLYLSFQILTSHITLRDVRHFPQMGDELKKKVHPLCTSSAIP